MPVAPCFDPTTGASGGSKGGGGVDPLAWQLLTAVDFRAQTPAIVGNGTSFSVVDMAGNTITGTVDAFLAAGLAGDVEAGWDATNGFYTKIAATTNNTVYKVAVPLQFPGSVVMGLDDDVLVKYYGRVNLPAAGNRMYWCALKKPLSGGTQYETDGALCVHLLRLNPTTSNIRFDFDGGQSGFIGNTPTAFNPATTLNIIDGTQDLEFENVEPRWNARGRSKLIVPGTLNTYVAFGGRSSAAPQFNATSSATASSVVPQQWNGKNKLMISNTIYNGAVSGGGNQISAIHKIEIYRRTLSI